jgi:hypothetical protein
LASEFQGLFAGWLLIGQLFGLFVWLPVIGQDIAGP